MADQEPTPLPDGMTHGDWAEGLRAEQRLALAIPAGLAAAVVGAVLWAAVAYLTGMELGLVAIAVGALVGIAVRRAGRGVDPVFGFLGGACAALGWAMGTLLSIIGFVAKQADVPFATAAARLGLDGTLSLAMQNADVIELVFLAIAVWEGYKFSFRARL